MKVQGYHIHIYGTPAQSAVLSSLRTRLLAELPMIQGAGPVRRGPVGPHPLPMFEAWFGPEVIGEVRAWAEKNRGGLSVLIHPLTGNDYDDHALHADWLGEAVALDLEFLK